MLGHSRHRAALQRPMMWPRCAFRGRTQLRHRWSSVQMQCNVNAPPKHVCVYAHSAIPAWQPGTHGVSLTPASKVFGTRAGFQLPVGRHETCQVSWCTLLTHW